MFSLHTLRHKPVSAKKSVTIFHLSLQLKIHPLTLLALLKISLFSALFVTNCSDSTPPYPQPFASLFVTPAFKAPLFLPEQGFGSLLGLSTGLPFSGAQILKILLQSGGLTPKPARQTTMVACQAIMPT
jgi:hypothetical protein